MTKQLTRKAENHRTKGWYLDNGEIEMFLTEEGGLHAPVTFFANSASPVQPYFLAPWLDDRPDLTGMSPLQDLRGDFFCLPFGGNGAPVNGVQVPCHGETCLNPWALLSARQDADLTVFEFAEEGKVLPMHVVKRIEMRSGHSALYLRHTVTGLDAVAPYGHHTILEMPSANEKMYFSCGKFDLGMTPTGLFSNPVNQEYQYLAVGATFDLLEAVPTMFQSPATHDYSVYPSPVGYTDMIQLMKRPTETPAWSAAAYIDRGYLFYTLKDAAVLPATTLWIANSGRYAFPWNGRTSCFSIEETCGYFADGWKASSEENLLSKQGWKTAGVFRKDTPFVVSEIQGVVRLPSGFGKVVDAQFASGKVTFLDTAGKSATAEVDWTYVK